MNKQKIVAKKSEELERKSATRKRGENDKEDEAIETQNMLSASSKVSITSDHTSRSSKPHHFKASSIENLSMPTLGISDHSFSDRPSLQFSDLSLDDASSAESRPYRNRSHAVDLMGVSLDSLTCKDDPTTGKHYTKVGSTKIQHPANHRRMSSSSRVAFAVAAYMAEQDEAVLSEKDADEDEADDDFDYLSESLDAESEPNLDEQFSFWEDYSCSCGEQETCAHKKSSQEDADADDDDKLYYEGQEQDDDGDDEQPRRDAAAITTNQSGRALPLIPPPSSPRSRNSSSNQRKTAITSATNLSPISVATLTLQTTTNTAA